MLIKKVGLLAMVLLAGCATTPGQQLPTVTHDGLHLVPDTQLRAVYMKPGANLAQYDKVVLLDTFVSFAKNWERNYNEEATFEDRVSDKDMNEIRESVASEFKKDFTRVLTAGGHEIVTTAGSGVLILRPAIIDLEITAPDLMTPGMNQTFVASAGSMTLYLELYDGKTQSIIARIIDPEAADDGGMAEVANRVTNTADFDRIVDRWAQILNAHLEQLKKS